MTIKNHRKQFEFSAARLRRGRRLYSRMIMPWFLISPEDTLSHAAHRAQMKGLYSQNTAINDIRSSLAIKILKHVYPSLNEFERRKFEKAWNKVDHLWYRASKKTFRFKRKKPVLRSVG